MRESIEERVVEIAEYIVKERATVRQAATVFGVSKSTVHKDVSERITDVDLELSRRVREVLDINKSERHLRGGNATKKKWMDIEKHK